MSGRASSGRWLRSTRTETKPRSWLTSDVTDPRTDNCSWIPVHYTPVAHYTTLASSFPTYYNMNWPEEMCRARRGRKYSVSRVLDVFFKRVFKSFRRSVGTMNVTCSSSSKETTVKWLKEEYREVIFSTDVAVHSKLLALINILRAPETALLLRPQPTQPFFKYANLCTCTFLLPFECFYMF